MISVLLFAVIIGGFIVMGVVSIGGEWFLLLQSQLVCALSAVFGFSGYGELIQSIILLKELSTAGRTNR